MSSASDFERTGMSGRARQTCTGSALFLMAAILGAAPSASAQGSLDARLGVAIDALSPGAFPSETRGTFDGTLAPEIRFSSERGRLHYTLDGGSYNTPGDWSFLAHALGGSYRIDLAGKEKARLYLGGSGALRRNGEAWSYADYDALAGFANFELRPRDGTTLRMGYRVTDRTFDEISDLDQLEQDGFASVSLNLQSRTTLIAEAHFGWKSYEGETLFAAVTPPDAPVSGTPAGGQGSSGSTGSGMGSGMRGMGSSAGLREASPVFVPVGTSGEQARQWNVLLRIAQGLGDRTGAWVQGFVRRTGGRVPPALVTTPAGFFDDGVYDDPYASDLDGFSLGLKHSFAGGAELALTGILQDKRYSSVAALGADGLPAASGALREDRITRAGLDVSMPVLAKKTGRFALDLWVAYAFTDSRSNDAFYDYSSHQASLGVAVSR